VHFGPRILSGLAIKIYQTFILFQHKFVGARAEDQTKYSITDSQFQFGNIYKYNFTNAPIHTYSHAGCVYLFLETLEGGKMNFCVGFCFGLIMSKLWRRFLHKQLRRWTDMINDRSPRDKHAATSTKYSILLIFAFLAPL